MDMQRLETARLLHRFGFGPRPGEFTAALNAGPAEVKRALLNPPSIDSGEVTPPTITDLGPRPAPNTPEVVPFSIALRTQSKDLTASWLDQMVLTQKPLQEKMVWFWHGHWASSIGKVN